MNGKYDINNVYYCLLGISPTVCAVNRSEQINVVTFFAVSDEVMILLSVFSLCFLRHRV